MTAQTPAAAEIEKWLQIRFRFFPNFWLRIRIRFRKKKAESCWSWLRCPDPVPPLEWTGDYGCTGSEAWRFESWISSEMVQWEPLRLSYGSL